jgi:integrase
MNDPQPTQNLAYAINPIQWEAFSAEVLACYEVGVRARKTRAKVREILRLLGGEKRGDGELIGGLRGPDGEPLVRTTADLTLPTITKMVANMITDDPERSANTLRGQLGYARTVCNYAAGMGYLYVSPFKLRKFNAFVRRAKPQAKKHHSREEIRRVLDYMRNDISIRQGWAQWEARRLYALTATVAMTALRAREAQCLKTADVDLSTRIIQVVPSPDNRLKTEGSEAPVPMPKALVPIVADWLPYRMQAPPDFPIDTECPWLFPTNDRRHPWTSGQSGRKPVHRLKAVAALAGVEDFTFLSLRHSWATHAPWWRLGPGTVKQVLRHTTERTQAYYTHNDIVDLASSVEDIDF